MLVNYSDIWTAFLQTMTMVSVSLLFSTLIGLPLGILLVVTRKGALLENVPLFTFFNSIVNIFRSIPFIILLVAIIPLTRLIVQTSIGTEAAIVPLVFYAAPYMARLIESSLLEVDKGVLEAAEAMGATPFQTIFRFLLPEALGSLILNLTIATVGLIGASAMAGAIGGGGLGDLAITYGYQRFDTKVMIITVGILVILVQGLQTTGNIVARKIRRH
ncbi:methionine ABC transporter permease [Exiguobacterium sp. Leaf187]|jgi:D-methionine transport system permease protein|uniref:Methionine ABC transporter permease n=2 Tax=Exiguobacterium TaxID=33986 RepID=A0A0V8GHU5_9BACL|nr:MULTISPECIES: methionine ABC transporter permease [Exiguobacterium]AHA30868.1 methionine ABC transporter permease [Exiguobacterium sp. MH3]EZP59777.1 Methionine ABC transporter permease [Exiguobacterium sp. RIT341]KQS20133.1 methionine ABC transporter permease [Exiguobacterium sp. Leaf187]KQS37406.1 methionine ABC transporter permease [Exiguobacterium sp. Leaf196]KSU49859.1 methionine ABC transporter permease [Exiguobacterium enclense]